MAGANSMKSLTISELSHFLRIQAACLFFATLLLATHNQFSVQHDHLIHYFYIAVITILAVGSAVQTTIQGDGRKRLFGLGFLYGCVSLVMLAMFYIR